MPNPELAITIKEVMKLAVEERAIAVTSVHASNVGSVYSFKSRLTGLLEEIQKVFCIHHDNVHGLLLQIANYVAEPGSDVAEVGGFERLEAEISGRHLIDNVHGLLV